MSSGLKLKIGGACLNQTPLDWRGNIDHILQAISEAKADQVQILCLPELCLTGYGCEDLFLSDWLPTKALLKLNEIIPHTEGILVSVGLPIRREGNTYNCIALIKDCQVLGFYAKHHLANEGVHYEHRWFSSWPYNEQVDIVYNGINVPLGSFTISQFDITIGFEICEDAWHLNRPGSNFINKAHLLLNPSASHFAFNKESFRENLVVESSKRFNCVYLYTNLLGNEAGRMIYDGDVLIAQKGKLIAHNKRFSFKTFNLLSQIVDFDTQTADVQILEQATSSLQEFGQAVPLALFDYLRKSRSDGFVISLSGGADSSSIAVLVAQMVRLGTKELGISNFCEKLGIEPMKDEKEIMSKIMVTAYQGTENSSSATLESAQTLAQSIGATFYHWRIDDEVSSYLQKIQKAIGRKLTWERDDIALQNIQARARSPIIWLLANLDRYLLLTTSNRSEGSVGYTTMDGDTSGSIAPIAAVDKYFLLEWLQYAELHLDYPGLRKVNELQPSAELRPLSSTQTDENDLMPYQALQAIELQAIRNRKSPLEVYQLLKTDYASDVLVGWIKKFYHLWAVNQWKRERLAPSFHVDDYNVDPRTWCRFPILSGAFREELEELDKL
ncbi:MAG: NAD+ synthase (glutamine-hydrolyzing) [Cyclobacteriaceae bacterium]|jgi:NAD+ synthase (glutamine-hydrolysing)